MHTIISTVGTSLFSNANRSLGNTLKVDQDHYEEYKKQLLDYLSNVDIKQASAETHALYWLGFDPSDKQTNLDNFYLVFLHSSTVEGKLCAEVLQEWYQYNFSVMTDVKEITGLQSANTTQFRNDGMVNLIKTLAKVIKENKSPENEVIVNATGGFKPETAYATLIGFLLGAKVVYVHELFKQLISLPPMPTSLKIDGQSEIKKRILSILNAETQMKANQLFKNLPTYEKVFIERREGIINAEYPKVDYHLSVLGEIIIEVDEEISIDAGDVRIITSVQGTHTSIWGDKIQYLSDIKNKEVVENLLLLCKTFNRKSIQVLEHTSYGSSQTFLISNIKELDKVVTFYIHIPEGKQRVYFPCENLTSSFIVQKLNELFQISQ